MRVWPKRLVKWHNYINVASSSLFLLQYTVREAAKSVGLWDTAPQLEEISPERMAEFYEAVCHHYALMLCHWVLCYAFWPPPSVFFYFLCVITLTSLKIVDHC